MHEWWDQLIDLIGEGRMYVLDEVERGLEKGLEGTGEVDPGGKRFKGVRYVSMDVFTQQCRRLYVRVFPS